MKKVLLLHPRLLFYKIKIYNHLSAELKKKGYDFYLWPTSIQTANLTIEFKTINKRLNPKNLIKITKKYQFQYVINILHGAINIGTTVTAILLCKLKDITYIYYGHGLDLGNLDKKWKGFLQNCLHLFADRILLYSPNEIKHLWKIHHKKIAIAYNTLFLRGYEMLKNLDPNDLKHEYGITQDKVVLFCGRIQHRKRLNLLIDIFITYSDKLKTVALVIVGPNMSKWQQEQITNAHNIYYLGTIYDEHSLSKVFKLSDVFSIPGHIGLGLVEAFYWGKPVVTLDVDHAPEIYYLRDSYNGFIVTDENKFYPTLTKLLFNKRLLQVMSSNARATFEEEAGIEHMFQGFYNILRK